MAVDNISNRVSALSSQIGKRSDLEVIDDMKSELMNVEASRAQNLATSSTANQLNSQQNQELSIAANLMAENSGVSPETTQVMSKYLKPGSTVNKSSKTVGGSTVINNITTNNIMTAPPNIPMKQKEEGGQNTAKLKAWIQGVFARQQQAIDLRNKEYEKKEWSLSRNSNKLMRAISNLGKSISTNLDPRKVSTFFGSQMKTVLFLFGMHFLAKAWPRVLGFVSKAEKAFEWMMGSGNEDDFAANSFGGVWNRRLIRFFGGDESKDAHVGIAIKNLFIEAFDHMKEKLDLMYKDRADAVQKVEFPEIKWSNSDPAQTLFNAFSSLGTYLKDVLSAMTGGNAGLAKHQAIKELDLGGAVRGEVDNTAKAFLGDNSYHWNRYRDFGIVPGGALAFYDQGALRREGVNAKIPIGTSGKWRGLLPNALDSNGNLTSAIESSYSQGLQIATELNRASSTGKINPASTAAGIARLVRASEYGGVYIPEELVKILPNEVFTSLCYSGDLIKVDCKYVKKNLQRSDLRADYTKSRHYHSKSATAFAYGVAGYGAGAAAEWGNRGLMGKIFGGNPLLPDKENVLGGIAAREAGTYKSYSDKMDAALKSDYYTLVPLEEPVAGLKNKDGKIIIITVYKASTKAIKEIAKYILKDKYSDNLNIHEHDVQYLRTIESALVERAKENNKAATVIHSLDNYYSKMNEADNNIYSKQYAALDKRYENGRLARMGGNISAIGNRAFDAVLPWLNSAQVAGLGWLNGSGQYPNTKEGRKKFVRDMYTSYINEGVSPTVALTLTAQDALESNWGTSHLARYFNYGGMNVPGNNPRSGWNYIETSDDGHSYKVVLGSMLEHVKYKLKNVILPNFPHVLSAETPIEALQRIMNGRGGSRYASDRDYIPKVMGVIDSVFNHLTSDAGIDSTSTTTPNKVSRTSSATTASPAKSYNLTASIVPQQPSSSKISSSPVLSSGFDYSLIGENALAQVPATNYIPNVSLDRDSGGTENNITYNSFYITNRNHQTVTSIGRETT